MRFKKIIKCFLKDIDKIWGHPSVAGMTAMCEQVSAFVSELR